MLTENDIKLHTFYGPEGGPRVAAFTWVDGPEGVNYSIEGLCTIDAMFTDKETFLDMANSTAVAPLAFHDAERRYGVAAGTVVNREAQTDEQAAFMAQLFAMKEDK